MHRDEVTTLEQALIVLGKLGARGIHRAEEVAEGVLALLDELDLVGLLDGEGELPGRDVHGHAAALDSFTAPL